MSADTEILLSLLTNALSHSARAVRFDAAHSIGRLAVKANIVGPARQTALTDPDRLTRSEGTNVLLRLAPKLLTNTPTK